MADHDNAPKGTENSFHPWDPEWIWPALGPDNYTLAEQDEQRWRLIKDLEQEDMLDAQLRTMLTRPETVEGFGAPEFGWLRLAVRRYHEGDFGLADVVAEIAGQTGR